MIAVDKKPIECDVLAVGGGVAGLMAAIAAADRGAKVVVAEKANSRRSGSGATGNDHYRCYIPEVHGSDIESIFHAIDATQTGGVMDKSLGLQYLRESFDRVKEWDSWGIPMRPHGAWEFVGHAVPGHPKVFLKYAGAEQKVVLTEQALKRGVTIMNKVPISEIITNRQGEVCGAIGVSVAEDAPMMKIFRAKTVVITTGNTSRLYPPRTAAWMFNTGNCPACTGTGRAAAYKVGAKLVNMDVPYTHAGPKYFSRCGKGTWAGVLSNWEGKPVSPFASTPTRDGDVAADIWKGIFPMKKRAGEVVYMNCTQARPEDIDYMFWGFKHEGITCLTEALEAEGIDVRKHMVEFQQYEPILFGRGIQIDENGESNVPGLYAAGDEVGNFGGSIAAACGYGHIAGRNAAARAAKINGFEDAENNPVVREKADLYSQILGRADGPSWKEANVAVQCLMDDYCGLDVRSEILFKTGLQYMGQLKKKACSGLKAGNSHELMRCLEALDLIEIGELVMLSANERKETRGRHLRVDYPYTNLLFDNKFITIQKINGEPKAEWRKKN